jgi:hypothetical protein
MKNVTSKPELSHPAIESNSHLFDDWFDPIEDMIRGQVRGLIEEMIRGELDATLSRRGCPYTQNADTREDKDRCNCSPTESERRSHVSAGIETRCVAGIASEEAEGIIRHADPAKADKRTSSKWSRVMRYVAVYKPDFEPLDQFIRRKGGINACAARFTRALGRGALRRTAD